jgi:hypothetical protein
MKTHHHCALTPSAIIMTMASRVEELRGCQILRAASNHEALDKEIRRYCICGIFATIQLIILCPPM